MERKEIMPFVYLTCVQTQKFKTSYLSLTLLTQLTLENAALNALVPRVLRRGTVDLPDLKSIESRLSGLYGARIEPVVRKKGEIHCIGFAADFADDKYVPGGERLLEPVAGLIGDLLLNPVTEHKMLCKSYVNSEKEKLIDDIKSQINDKRQYSVQRVIELMCNGENYGVSRYGNVETAEEITVENLTKRYHELLGTSCIEIFYCGTADMDRVEQSARNALADLPPISPDYNLGTDVRMNTIEEGPRYYEEELNVTQGKLAIGFRLGDCMENPDIAAIMVFNAIYGGGVNSKLFMNVREKLSLCYFASSIIEKHKGIMIVSSGIEFKKYNDALTEIMAQLNNVKSGNVTVTELSDAKKYLINSMRTVMDSQARTEDFYLDQNIEGWEYGPTELAEMILNVSKEDVVKVASGVSADAVYFLRGEN